MIPLNAGDVKAGRDYMRFLSRETHLVQLNVVVRKGVHENGNTLILQYEHDTE